MTAVAKAIFVIKQKIFVAIEAIVVFRITLKTADSVVDDLAEVATNCSMI